MKNNLYTYLSQFPREEVVKNRFLNMFGYELCTIGDIDHVGINSLVEAKKGVNFKPIKNLASTVAQILGYCNRIYFGKKMYEECELKEYLIVLSDESASIMKTSDFMKYFTDNSGKYNWNTRASNPDKNLIADLCDDFVVRSLRVYDFRDDYDCEDFSNEFKRIESGKSAPIKKIIDISSIIVCYKKWLKQMDFINLKKSDKNFKRDFFFADITNETSSYDADAKKLTLNVNGRIVEFNRVTSEKYNSFWQNYNKIEDMKNTNFRAAADRLLEMADRRWKGDFYTPNELAELGWSYIWENVSYDDLAKGKIVINDNCVGSGNLIYPIGENNYKHCIMTSIRKDDTEYCSPAYAPAIVFQCDYLNDYTEEGYFNSPHITDEMRAKLNDPDVTLILNINPPYSNSSNKKNCCQAEDKKNANENTKDGISNTKVKKMMEAEGLKNASSQLYVQFLYRIIKEVSKFKCKVILGLYCPINFFNNVKTIKFREMYFNKKFLGGFCFCSQCFHGTSDSTGWGVSYTLWDLKTDVPLANQDIILDVLDDKFNKIGTKQVEVMTSTKNLLKTWVDYETTGKNKIYLPTMKSAFNITNKLRSVNANHLCGMNLENKPVAEVSNFVVSSIQNGHIGFSVTPKSFERAFTAMGIHKSSDFEWYNVDDNYNKPKTEIPSEIVNDLVVYGVFCETTKSGAYTDVEVIDTTTDEVTHVFNLNNELMPFTRDEVREFFIEDETIIDSLNSDSSERMFAKWLKGKNLSPEAQAVMDVVKEMYEQFYRMELPWDDYLISSWDVGFYQILRAFRDNGSTVCKKLENKWKEAMDNLKSKNSTVVWDYGIIEQIDLFETK
jgi:hypothetical protein